MNCVVIILSYNNRRWYKRNLSSVLSQDYKNFRIVYVDDCSSDGTGALVEQFVSDSASRNVINLIHNPVRLGALENLFYSIHRCLDDEIAVVLDGDDWFAHNQVLRTLNEVYTETDCWMSYGQYQSWPDNSIGLSTEIPGDIINNNSFRENRWCSSHLRSFYVWLFKLIRREDLLGPNGSFYQMAGDQAIMFPMLEMSGLRAKYISEVLYIYNAANPINDHKVDRELQRSLEMKIRGQRRYERLVEPVRSRAR